MPKINTSVITDKSITKEKLNDELQGKINNIGTMGSLKTNSKDTLVNSINELFQYVSNGKTLVANAITGKGIDSNGNMSFQQLATNIDKISIESLGGGRILKGTTKAYAHFTYKNTTFYDKYKKPYIPRYTSYIMDISEECNFNPKILMIFIPDKDGGYQLHMYNYYTMMETLPYTTYEYSGTGNADGGGSDDTSEKISHELDLTNIYVLYCLYTDHMNSEWRYIFSSSRIEKTVSYDRGHKTTTQSVPEYIEIKWMAIGE